MAERMRTSVHARALTIGSRGSQLALWQAHHVACQLQQRGVASQIEVIKTTGDRLQTAPLGQSNGKALFTKEIEDALLAGSIDVAVHSLKDLATDMPHGLTIAAIPEREDPRDAILGRKLGDVPAGARVGTSSGRRAGQLRLSRPDIDVQPIRGNVDTRIRKLRQGQYDAIVLAVAGLRRLGLEQDIAEIFEPEQMCPAAGQGALAIQTREMDAAYEICSGLNHEASRQAVLCERTALGTVGGGCELPVGAFAQIVDGVLRAIAVVISADGKHVLRATSSGSPECAEKVGRALAEDVVRQGAARILAESKLAENR